jgi:coproporphyrinogen III oxidase
MDQHSRDIIIQVLKQYDNTGTEEVYDALAWIGLMGNGVVDEIITGLPPQPTVAWENTPQAERLNILKIYDNFKKTNSPCQ